MLTFFFDWVFVLSVICRVVFWDGCEPQMARNPARLILRGIFDGEIVSCEGSFGLVRAK